MAPIRSLYGGSCQKLVLAFDMGTTYSGVSYSILTPGLRPEIKGVTRFPAQESTGGSSKIPTIMYYDRSGAVQAVGAEAVREGIQVEAEDKQWLKTEWFKLHLRPKDAISFEDEGPFSNLPPLPLNKSIVEVLADFYRYLLDCSAKYIRESHANGDTLWCSIQNNIDFVLSHPNGWGGNEQSQMRQAARLAGLIPDNTSKSQDRISFVTEGEASLHFIIQSDVLDASLKKGEGVLIVDAGGGTIDISSYRQLPEARISFEEIASPHCLFTGSLLVDMNAKSFLEKYLEGSPFAADVDHIISCFNKTCKPAFKDSQNSQYIRFGASRDEDPEHNIRHGQLVLSGSDVASFFKPSAAAIKRAILDQRTSTSKKIVHVVLVGGFSSNEWLFNNLKAFLGRVDPTLRLLRPEERVTKTVSDGAISFYIDHFVRSRMAKFTFGTICSVQYNPNNAEHVKRAETKFISPSGETRIPGMFCTILNKDTPVMKTTEFRGTFNQVSYKKSDFRRLVSPVWCYRGSRKDFRWKDVDAANCVELCTITCDLSSVHCNPLKGHLGRTYYRVEYEIVLLFGLTELKAQVAWKENGVEKRSPAQVVYNHA